MISLLSAYLNLNLLLIVGCAALGLMNFIAMSAKQRLQLHYSILFFVLFFVALQFVTPRSDFSFSSEKNWSPSPVVTIGHDSTVTDDTSRLHLPVGTGKSGTSANTFLATWIMIVGLVFFIGFLITLFDVLKLAKIQRTSFRVRKIGAVEIFVNDSVRVPFAFWLPFRASIVLPTNLLNRRDEFRIAVTHELQHHRQKDTQWVYLIWGLKVVCFINPAIHFWNKWIAEIQEFACDEALVDLKNVESQAYARCLVEIAKTAIHEERMPVCATGMIFSAKSNLLKRRIQKMFSNKRTHINRSINASITLVICTLLGVTAFASRDLVQDRRITIEQAQKLAETAQTNPKFPITVNEHVLKQLNVYLGTPEGREYMKQALARMENYQPMLRRMIRKYKVPSELLAVPIVESGYQNLPPKNGDISKSAGLWQFIQSTARLYGLRVWEGGDQRLRPRKATDAALRYLLASKVQLTNWELAILAYNAGDRTIAKGILQLDTHDAWKLVEHGFQGDKDYLAKVIAAVIIMKNPETLN